MSAKRQLDYSLFSLGVALALFLRPEGALAKVASLNAPACQLTFEAKTDPPIQTLSEVLMISNEVAIFLRNYGMPESSVLVNPELNIEHSYANTVTKQVVVGLRGLPATSKVRAFIAHEMSHLAFEDKFKLVIDGKLRSFTEVRNLAADFLETSRQNPEYKGLISKYSANKQWMELSPPEREAQSRALLLTLHHPTYLKLEGIAQAALAYHELFADMTSVLLNKDPSAIANAFSSARNRKVGDIRERDFLGVRKVRMWKTNPSGHRLTEYDFFDPARGALWRSILKGLKPGQESKFLDAFTVAASKHMNARIEKNQIGEEVDIPSLNREFFKIVLRESGL